MNKLLLTALLLTCSGFGFFAGYLLSRDTQGQVTTSPRPGATFEVLPNLIPDPATMSSDTSRSEVSVVSFETLHDQVSIFDKLMYAHVLADQSSVTELENLIHRAVGIRDPLFSYNIVGIFLEKYTAVDPLGAIDFVDNSNELSDRQFISHIVTSWVRTDPEGAIDYYKSITDLRIRNELGGRLLSDPTIKGTGFEDEILDTLGSNGRTLAGIMSTRQLPPDMAFEQALTLDPVAKQSALQTALIRWMRVDPEEAVARILQHPNNDERTRMLQGVLNEYVSINEDVAFDFAQTHLTGNVRTEQHMLSVLAQRNPKRTLPLVEEFIARTGNIGPLNGIMSTWVQQEPEAALAYVETLEPGQQTSMYQAIAYSYVNSHPIEGFQWLLSKQDDQPQMVRNTIMNAINHQTLNTAERTVGQIDDKQLKTQLITGIGNYKASQDPELALSWLEQYKSDPAYEIAVQNVISTMSYQNPRGAAVAIEGRLDSQSAVPLVGQIATNWYRASPEDALAWVDGLDAGEAKASALSNMVMMVVQQDPDAAKRMIRSIPEGKHRDNARRNAAYALIGEAPEEVEDIIADLGISDRDAVHMRELANSRSRASSAFISGG